MVRVGNELPLQGPQECHTSHASVFCRARKPRESAILKEVCLADIAHITNAANCHAALCLYRALDRTSTKLHAGDLFDHDGRQAVGLQVSLWDALVFLAMASISSRSLMKWDFLDKGWNTKHERETGNH